MLAIAWYTIVVMWLSWLSTVSFKACHRLNITGMIKDIENVTTVTVDFKVNRRKKEYHKILDYCKQISQHIN